MFRACLYALGGAAAVADDVGVVGVVGVEVVVDDVVN